MFPYAAIIASSLLNKNAGKRESIPPAISTLSQYTSLTNDEFKNQMFKVTNANGLFTALDAFGKYQNFDTLSEVKKRMFIYEMAPSMMSKSKPTIVERIKDYFNI